MDSEILTCSQSCWMSVCWHRLVCDRGSPDGWYMYADSSNGGYGQTSDLITPVISSTGPHCTLEFWYHLSGFTVGSLQVGGSSHSIWDQSLFEHCLSSLDFVTQVLLKYQNLTHEVWSQTGNQGNRWRRGEVFLGFLNNFQVCVKLKHSTLTVLLLYYP